MLAEERKGAPTRGPRQKSSPAVRLRALTRGTNRAGVHQLEGHVLRDQLAHGHGQRHVWFEGLRVEGLGFRVEG